MRQTYHSPAILVLDDFLDAASYRNVLAFVATDDYRPVHQAKWSKAWKLTDGMPFVGTHYFSHPRSGVKPAQVFGSGAPIDALFQKIFDNKDTFTPWIGEQKRDWNDFQLSAYLYPAGTGSAWHDDGYLYSGSCVYYAHPAWRGDWGGELLVTTESATSIERTFRPESGIVRAERALAGWRTGAEIGPNYFEPDLDEAVLGSGVGIYVQPRPNRMIFLTGRHTHCIKRVDPHAGSNVRCSISGFFAKAQKT